MTMERRACTFRIKTNGLINYKKIFENKIIEGDIGNYFLYLVRSLSKYLFFYNYYINYFSLK